MHLTSLKNLSTNEIIELINRALEFKRGATKTINKKVANLFFEPSTRTHYSFVSAQMNLGMKSTDFNASSSSVLKGETLYDTVKTFEAIGFDALVIRHSQDRYYEELKDIKIPIINGGDGKQDHPTQSLLDLMTIYEEFGKFTGLNIVIVGDIKHSRVAHSNIDIMGRLGMNVFIAGPEEFLDKSAAEVELDSALKSMDVVMLLRVQHERHSEKSNVLTYNEQYGLNANRLAEMKKDAVILHPAPFNRGVELTDEVVEDKKSRIFEQMTNGVYIRMAVLERVCC